MFSDRKKLTLLLRMNDQLDLIGGYTDRFLRDLPETDRRRASGERILFEVAALQRLIAEVVIN
jgi:hypothetical protein